MEFRKVGREGRVFLDTTRNGPGAHIVAAYSPRARPGAPVSFPVPWDELERAKRYLVGAHEISLQRRAAVASTLAFHECYGLGWDEYTRYAAAILAVTAADVQRVAQKYFTKENRAVAIYTRKPGTQPKEARDETAAPSK